MPPLVEEEFEERCKQKTGENEEKVKSEHEGSEDSDEEEEELEEEEDDECVLKGKSTSLSAFFRVAKNWMTTVFKVRNLALMFLACHQPIGYC